MMYHRIFRLSSSAGCPVVICSSLTSRCTFSGVLLCATAQHPRNDIADPKIEKPEVKGKQKYRNNDHGGSRLNFLSGGKGDLAHFIANVGKKSYRARWELLQLSADALFVTRHNCCFCHPISYFPKTQLAGAEGFEPPSPVLETGSLTVELTPLL